MTLFARTSASIKSTRYRLTAKTLALCFTMVGGIHAWAQSVVLPPTPVSNTPPATAALSTPSESRPPSLGIDSPLQWGFLNFHPHFFYKFLYGEGLLSSPGRHVASTINSFSPGLLADIGTHWTLDYTPTQTYYSDPSFKDTLDHSVRLLGDTSYENWTLHLSQTFTSSFNPLIETGQQTSEDRYDTGATVGYRVNDRVLLDTNFSYDARFTTEFPDSRETTVGEEAHYQFTPQVDVSLKFDYGYVNMSEGSDMTYTRPAVQLNWQATDKTSINLQAGYEKRKFRSGGAPDLNSPTFGAQILFQPVTTTSISLTANHGVGVSYFNNQVTKDTGWKLNVQQRLLQHYYLSAGYSEQKSLYVSTDPTVVTNRDDKNYLFDLRLSTVLFQRITVAAVYQNAHNTSNFVGYGFNSKQYGFELGYQF